MSIDRTPDFPTFGALSRRSFVSAAAAGGAAGLMVHSSLAAAEESRQLRLALVGCGGRGSGAINDSLTINQGVKLVAAADLYDSRCATMRKAIAEAHPDKVDLDDSRIYSGLDGYKRVLDDPTIDVVLITTSPGFRPRYVRAAVEAGKHIFCEKPMATDAPGVRSVIESVRIAKERSLALVAGFCWRYDYPLRELFKRIHEGQIGDVRAIYGTYLTGPVKPMPPASSRKEGMIRNWYNFNWLGGDGFVEQAVHTCDWLAWVMKDVPPVSCTAVGGRQIPVQGGNIYDHIEANYVWADGTLGFLSQRQIPGCFSENHLTVIGSKGTAHIDSRGASIAGDNAWRYQGEKPSMYQVEHNELFASIRSGKPINDGDRMAKSTLLGIMGRNAAYTGQQLTWDMILNSQQVLVPDIKDWDTKFEPEPLAMPGRTKFI